MFKRILVPLDGSTRAESAIPIAARIAHASGGSIVLLRVVNTPIEYGMYLSQPAVLTEKDVHAEINRANEYLSDVAQSDVLEGIDTTFEAISGAIAPTILAYAQPTKADLIVMCSHGYTGVKRWMMGSVADKITRHAPVPVLVLREHGSLPVTPSNTAGQVLRALVALDGSPLSEAILEPVAELVSVLASPLRGALHLLRVIDVPVTHSKLKSKNNVSPELAEHMKADAKAYLASIVEKLENDIAIDFNLGISSAVVTDADVAGAIIKEAENVEVTGGYAFIAMSTHGRGGLERWTAGSVTERTLHGTQLPLFIVRPPHAVKKHQAEAKEEAPRQR